MADDVQIYDVTCPEQTPAASALEIPTIVASIYVVTKVWIIIPDGHSGLTGIALAYGHQPVVPSNPGAFISGNDEEFPIPLSGKPLGVPWSVFVCNNDLQAHTWETRWELTIPLSTPTTTTPTPIPVSAIQAAAVAAGNA